MSTNPPILPFYSPGVQSLMPMFYVAWADRVLSPSEVELLQQKVQELGFLKPQEKAILQQWMNPARPPSRELFKHWEIELRKSAQQLPKEKRNSFAALGIEMAQRSAVQYLEPDANIKWSSEETKQALEGLEKALGDIDTLTFQRIFQDKVNEERELDSERCKATFSADSMGQLLDKHKPELRQRVKTLLQDPAFQRDIIPDKDAYRLKILEWTKLLAAQGFGALAYPTEYGGGSDMEAYATIFEMLGYFDMSLAIKFGVQFGLFGGSVHALGTERHHAKYLKDIGTLDLAGCFAMTETGHGSNVRQLETTATYDPITDEFVVHSPTLAAGKEYIGNALHSQMASVFCQLIVKGENHGVHAVLVPLRDENGNLLEGRTVKDNGYKLGLNGVDNGRIWFDQVRVPRENLLNRFGDVDENGEYSSPIENPSRRFFTMLGTLVGGRVCVPRAGLSGAKTGLNIAINYALKRRQFGKDFNTPEVLILDYPSHQRRLMPLLAKAYALNFGLDHLLERFLEADEESIREVETLAAGMKSYATWFTTETLQECREACGGKGYLAENRFADLKADTDIFTTFEGDNTVLMQLVAKGVLTTFRQSFNEEGAFGMLRFVGGQVATAITEMNPITVRNSSREHLLDSATHLQAFEYREDRMKLYISQKMRGLIKDGNSAYDAAMRCQRAMLDLAEAFVERTVLEQFIKVVEVEENVEQKAVLKQVCDLYALHTIEQHKGWYLERGYMESAKTKAVTKLVDELCATVRHQSCALVDAFGIPRELLAAPIAL